MQNLQETSSFIYSRHFNAVLPHDRCDSGCISDGTPGRPRKRPTIAAKGPHRPRAVLQARQAMQIYLYRPRAHVAVPEPILRGDSLAVGKRFGISPKAVRDIWTRRSWADETRSLWAPDEQACPPPARRPRAAGVQSKETGAAEGSDREVERPLQTAGVMLLVQDATHPPQVANLAAHIKNTAGLYMHHIQFPSAYQCTV
jgi:hypothetical protein